MKLAVVGTGNIVRKFLRGVVRSQELVWAAVCSRTEENAKKLIEDMLKKNPVDNLSKDSNMPDMPSGKKSFDAPSIQIYTDYEALLLEEEIAFIYVALPNSLHYTYTKKALLAGKHVICEKPFTVTGAEAKELAELAKAKDLFLFEAITTRYLPNYQKIQQKVSALGKIRMVQCNFSQYSSRYDDYQKGELPNVFNPVFAGGALNDLNVYNLHFVLGLFGKPQEAFYRANLGREGIDLSGVAVLGYDGFQAVCVAAKDSASPNFALIQGEKGYLVVESESSRCRKVTVCIQGEKESFGEEQAEENVLVYEVLAFEQMIKAGEKELCYQKLADSIEVMEVLEKLREG